MRSLVSISLLICSAFLMAQPEPCGPNPQMTSFCDQACIICDIDGFSGINDLTAQGQGFDEFCTTQFNNMQYIGFIAGSEDLTIQVTVGTCMGGVFSLEVGFFYTEDCENFVPITDCDTEITDGQSTIFSNYDPLIIGQHYYLVIDGSLGSNCTWTFTVLEGTTDVGALVSSGMLTHPDETCPGQDVIFDTTGEVGASFYTWTIDGNVVSASTSGVNQLSFAEPGNYEVCVTAENVCDMAPPTCSRINVREIDTLRVFEKLCDGECVNYNNTDFCSTGNFEEVITLASGCDSIIEIEVEVFQHMSETVDLWICDGEEYYLGPTPYDSTGFYIDTLRTSENCDSIVSLDLLTIECEIIGTPDEIPAICNETATGTLIFSVDQGEPPLTYVYTNIADGNITGTGMTNLLIDNEINNIPAGTYQIYISDDFGNDVVVLQTVTEPPRLLIDFMASDYNGFQVSCFSTNGLPGADGTLMAMPSGGVPPYTYLWSDGQTTALATGLMAQEYFITVTDEVGCEEVQSFTLESPPAIDPDILFEDPNCDGFETGIITINQVSGGTAPYTYSLNQDNVLSTDTMWTSLSEGTYTVYVEDANGCVLTIDSQLTAPQIPVVDFIEDLEIFLGDSTTLQPQVNNIDIQSISWTPVDDLSCSDCLEPIASPVDDELFTITITSIDDCDREASIRVRVEKRRRVYVPTVFTPEGGFDNIFLINAGREADEVVNFYIYDRWGSLVFYQKNFAPNDPRFGWNGRLDNKKLEDGIYVWMANIKFIDDVVENYAGTVMLLE